MDPISSPSAAFNRQNPAGAETQNRPESRPAGMQSGALQPRQTAGPVTAAAPRTTVPHPAAAPLATPAADANTESKPPATAFEVTFGLVYDVLTVPTERQSRAINMTSAAIRRAWDGAPQISGGAPNSLVGWMQQHRDNLAATASVAERYSDRVGETEAFLRLPGLSEESIARRAEQLDELFEEATEAAESDVISEGSLISIGERVLQVRNTVRPPGTDADAGDDRL